jgi:hypothetical protein
MYMDKLAMKIKQNILVIIFIGLAALTLVACADATEPPEPQQVAAADTDQPTAPAAQPAVVVEPTVLTHPEVAGTQTEIEPVVSTTFVEWVPNGPVVEGAESTLVRMKHGFYATFSAVELEPGDAYTMWWVIFNKPENCSDGECGENDAFIFDNNNEPVLTDEGGRLWNFPAHAATEFAIGRASGSIVDMNGTAEFRAHLPLGDDTEFDFGPGLLKPFLAEVHLIIRTHGQMMPGLLHEQLNTPWGGCPEGWPKDPCKDVQLAIHGPPG